jgi:hypothetical protein
MKSEPRRTQRSSQRARRSFRKDSFVSFVVKVLLVSVLVFGLVGCGPQDRCNDPFSNAPTAQVLFVGNSYTYVNDLPGTFARLACSSGRKVHAGMSAQGGWRLVDHAGSEATLNMIAGQKWDVVVLQEQSEIPAVADLRLSFMNPGAHTLIAKIRAAGAQPVLFLTWAHRDGLLVTGREGAGQLDFMGMQAQLTIGYTGVSMKENVPIVPVGKAWAAARAQKNPPDLWASDGSHPNLEGTYLAACVFYAFLFQQSPEGLEYWGGIAESDAHAMQTLAAKVVMGGK